MTEIADKVHALLSPSGAHRWTRCPGSVVLEAGLPDSSSSYARWGTCAHEVAGLILQHAVHRDDEVQERWFPACAESYIGRVFQIEGHDVEFDGEMADCVNDYVAHVESFWEPGNILIVEQAVPLEQITGEKDATGTSDCIILKLRAREIVVIDLKGGKGVMVDAEDNEQGLMYADGAVHEYDLLYGPFDRVRIVIIQPRLEHVSEWLLDIRAFELNIATIQGRADAVRDAQQWDLAVRVEGTADAPEDEFTTEYLNPGEKQCRFCKAKAICPALEGAVSDALSLTAPAARADEFPDLSLPKQAAAAIPGDDDRWIDEAKLAKAWKAIPLVEQWIEAIRSTTHALLHDGKPVGDLCLYEGRQGSRFWKDAEAAEQRLKKARVKADLMYSKSLISPTTAEKLYKDGTISETVFADLAEYIDRADGKPTVGVQGDPKKTPWSPAKPEDFPDLSVEEDPLFA